MQSGRMPGSQFVIDEWSQTYDIVPVEATARTLPENLDVLAVIHPENLSPQLRFAIDQFILSGKPVFLAVDPSSEYFKHQGGQAAMYGMPAPPIRRATCPSCSRPMAWITIPPRWSAICSMAPRSRGRTVAS